MSCYDPVNKVYVDSNGKFWIFRDGKWKGPYDSPADAFNDYTILIRK